MEALENFDFLYSLLGYKRGAETIAVIFRKMYFDFILYSKT